MREVPPGWAKTSIGTICELNPPLPKDALEGHALCSFVPMVAVEEQTGRLDASQARPFNELRARSYRAFRDNDVLLAKITPSMENGKGAVARDLTNGIGFGSTEFHVLRPRPSVEPWFVMHYALQKRFRAEARRHMTGTAGQLRVPAAFLESAVIPLPPTAEQHRIVAAIEEQFSRLDAAEDSLGRAKQMLVRLRNSVVANAVSGDWPTRRLDDVTESQIYGTSAKASRDSDGVPVLRMGNIRDGLVDFTDMKYLPHGHSDIVKCRLAPGDLLFNRTNSPELVGKSAVFTSGPDPTVFASYLIRVRLTNDCDPSWAALVINSEFGRRYVASVRTQQVGQANVNGTKLAAMPIPLPPIDVQRHILEQLDEWTVRVHGMAGAVENSRRRSALLRRSILDLAFSGGLVRQDPADEPASVLLERIATECATRPKPSRRRRRVPA